MKTQLSIPATNAIIFRFEDIWTPEGTLRVTLWRDLLDTANKVALPGGIAQASGKQFTNIEFKLRTTLLTKLPVIEKETENYFSEAHTNGFDLGFYNTRNYDDVLSITGWPKQGRKKTFADPFTLDEDYTTGRFIFRYLKPTEATELYGMVEFKADGESDYTIMEIGQAQNAIGGEDYRWYHSQDSQLLDARDNAPLDAEQIYDFRFVHVASSALDKVPAQPSVRTDGKIFSPNGVEVGESYYMPFYDGDQNNPSGSANAALPYPSPANFIGQVAQVSSKAQYFDTISGQQYSMLGLWRRHIHIYEWLRRLFDYAFGTDGWVCSCDLSPLSFQIARLNAANVGSASVTGGDGEAANRTGRDFILLDAVLPWVCRPKIAPFELTVSATEPTHDIWLPQCLWGLYDPLVSRRGVPKLTDTFPKRYTSSWQVLVEICYHFGWLPLVHTRQDGKAEIEFHDRTQPKNNKFTTILPASAKPTAFPESEDGISIARIKSFQNATTVEGEWDDWYSAHNGVKDSSYDPNGIGSLVNPRQPNPYTVPSTAQKPAKITTSLSLGADNNGWKTDILGNATTTNDIGWYSMGYPTSSAFVTFDALDTEAFPMLTPLARWNSIIYPMEWSGYQQNRYGGELGYVTLEPLAKGRFDYTLSDGKTVVTVTADSFRQLLARFYALEFVKSDFKYECEYPTINHFYALDADGNVTGDPSWSKIELYYQSTKPDGEWYYTKRLVRDFNTMKTTTEELRIVSPALQFENNGALDFHDYTELTGNNPGPPPDNGPTNPTNPTKP